MIMDTMVDHNIPLADCRAQSYDNGANMSGKYKGVQAKILVQYSAAIFSHCGCHTLNICDNDAAESVTEAVAFYWHHPDYLQSKEMGDIGETHWLTPSWHIRH